MGRKVNYSQGDNLPLYATPEQSLQQQRNIDNQRQLREDSERKKLKLKHDLFLQQQQKQTREELLMKMSGSSKHSSSNKRISSSNNNMAEINRPAHQNYGHNHEHQPVPLSNSHIYKNQHEINSLNVHQQQHRPSPQMQPDIKQQYMMPGDLDSKYTQQPKHNYQPKQQQFSQSYQNQPQMTVQSNYVAQDLSFNSIGSSGNSDMNSQQFQPPQLYQSHPLSSPSSSSTLSTNKIKNFNMGSHPMPLLSNGSGQSFQQEDPKEMAIQLFHKYDVTKSGRLTSHELQQALQNDDFSPFKISTIDSIINLFGVSRFNSLNLNEFVYMYHKLSKWRDVYIKNDTNGSHTLTTLEFTESVKSMGYKIPIEVVENLFDQFAEFIGGSKCLKFDRFVESVIWLIRLTKVFRQFDVENNGVGVIEYKDFIDISLYLGKFLPR